jgi:hypothetical protein
MQAIYARYRFERRLLVDGVLWSLAAAGAYLLARQAGAEGLLPTTVQLRLSHVPVQQFSDAFPTFAAVIALSTLCVWGIRCGKSGAAFICAGWMLLGLGFQYGQRSDVAAWVLPQLPSFFHTVWPLNRFEHFLGRGGFSPNEVLATVLAGIIAYVMVLNSIPNRCRA